MSDLAVHGEYWYTDHGSLLSATDGGDYNHEGHVMETIIGAFCDVMGVENEWQTDAVAFRTAVFDQTDWDAHPDDYDPFDEVCETLRKHHPAEQVEQMRSLLGGAQMDARSFAIKWWKWIRIAGPNAELPDLSRAMLKRAWEAFADIWFEETADDLPEEAEVTVSLLNGVRHSVTMEALERATLGDAKDADLDHLSRVSTEQVKQMDRDAMHPFYRGRLGESLIKRLLTESKLSQ